MKSGTIDMSPSSLGPMTGLRRAVLLTLSGAALFTDVQGQGASAGDKTITLPLKPTRKVQFTTDEGTWMNVDVSPDGTRILFDLLGDIYTLRLEGGKATRVIGGGISWDIDPRWSPDGKQIVFLSDRDGSQNVWLARPDGSGLRALTKTTNRIYVSPAWAPDGKSVVVHRGGTYAASDAPALIRIHLDGGSGVSLGTNGKSPTFGADPRYLYFTESPGYGLGSARVSMLDLLTGETSPRASANGGAMRPAVSHDARWLVYATRLDAVTSLKVRDLKSGDDRWLVKDVQRDAQEGAGDTDFLPAMSFTADSRALVVAHHGKLWKVDVPSGQATAIPFTVDVDLDVAPLAKTEFKTEDDTVTARQIRNARVSPDGRQMAFGAFSKIWLVTLADCRASPAGTIVPSGGCTPRRLTTATDEGEFYPTWSPDGRSIAYVTWTEEGGHVKRAAVSTSPVAGETLTRRPGLYQMPVYTPDGARIVYSVSPRAMRNNPTDGYGFRIQSPTSEATLAWIPSGGGEATTIMPIATGGTDHFGNAHFLKGDASRLYMRHPTKGLVSVRWDGTDMRTHLKVTGGSYESRYDEVLISPDGSRALALGTRHVYVIDLLQSGKEVPVINVQAGSGSLPIRRVSREGVEFLGWRDDNSGFYFTIGNTVYQYDLAAAERAIRDSTEKAATGTAPRDTTRGWRTAYSPTRIDIAVTLPKDRPSGTVALRGARIITMKGNEIIPNGDIVVRESRIVAVGPRGKVSIPKDAKVIDVKGKTILPGYVDLHDHVFPEWRVHRSQVWQYLADLAYGITTSRDPQTETMDILSYADLVDAGDVLGPRVLSTGEGIFGEDQITSLEAARDVVRRYHDHFRAETVKQYMIGDRKARQWFIMACKELGVNSTAEGGSGFNMNMTLAMDGYPGQEHSWPIYPIYKDVATFIAQSGLTYTPTLIVNYGGPASQGYYTTKFNPHDDAKVQRYTPHAILDRRTLRTGWVHEMELAYRGTAAAAAKLAAAGGRVGMGAHGNFAGLGSHWEILALASGGMPPHEVLRAATFNGADAIGHGSDLGSIEPGKLADLQVLDKNPLENLDNIKTIRYVMKNGRLYDGFTLDEVWPRTKKLPPQWWWSAELDGRASR
jgi:imidazolonepropionase-like amidohydrolase/Tol biopolymer transport system component